MLSQKNETHISGKTERIFCVIANGTTQKPKMIGMPLSCVDGRKICCCFYNPQKSIFWVLWRCVFNVVCHSQQNSSHMTGSVNNIIWTGQYSYNGSKGLRRMGITTCNKPSHRTKQSDPFVASYNQNSLTFLAGILTGRASNNACGLLLSGCKRLLSVESRFSRSAHESAFTCWSTQYICICQGYTEM